MWGLHYYINIHLKRDPVVGAFHQNHHMEMVDKVMMNWCLFFSPNETNEKLCRDLRGEPERFTALFRN